ncbi:MAG: hypothetical protein J0I06_05610 [Planctomycetes bacterium]|nr:hypothetical protein [Planctomycetota bacterium]
MTPLLIVLALAAAPVPKDDAADREFREKVDAARLKAVKFLKDKQDKDGSWESTTLTHLAGHKGGTTALAALALLEAGAPANDPAVARAVEYLLPLKPEKTYVVSLQTQVLARVDAKKHAKQIQANADWLMDKAIFKEKKLEGWSYPANHIGDNSNTHFAVTGLHAAAQAGAKVDAGIWQQVRDYYAATQKKNGGWAYHNAGDTSASQTMTAVGLLALAVAVKYDERAKGQDPAFDKGMALLLSGQLGELGEAGKTHFIALMTVAELGHALSATAFKAENKTKAWYREGVEKLLKRQQKDGSLSYSESERGVDSDQPVISTAAGLYFLGPPAKK